MLQHLYLFLGWYFLVCIFGILFIKVFPHLISYLLKLKFNIFSFSFDHFLNLFIIVCFFSEFDSFERISIKLKELESELNIDADMSQIINDYFLYIKVLKCVWISD